MNPIPINPAAESETNWEKVSATRNFFKNVENNKIIVMLCLLEWIRFVICKACLKSLKRKQFR